MSTKKVSLFFDSDEEPNDSGVKKNKNLFNDTVVDEDPSDEIARFKQQRVAQLAQMKADDEDNVKISMQLKKEASNVLSQQKPISRANKPALLFEDDDEPTVKRYNDLDSIPLGEALKYETEESQQIKSQFAQKQQETARLLEEDGENDDMYKFLTTAPTTQTHTVTALPVKNTTSVDMSLFGGSDDDDHHDTLDSIKSLLVTTPATAKPTTKSAVPTLFSSDLFADDELAKTTTDTSNISDDFDFGAYLKNNQ